MGAFLSKRAWAVQGSSGLHGPRQPHVPVRHLESLPPLTTSQEREAPRAGSGPEGGGGCVGPWNSPAPLPLHGVLNTLHHIGHRIPRPILRIFFLLTGWLLRPRPDRVPPRPDPTSGSPPDSKHLELAQPTAPGHGSHQPRSLSDSRPPPRGGIGPWPASPSAAPPAQGIS